MKYLILLLYIYAANINADVWLHLGGVSKHSSDTNPATGDKFNERHAGFGCEYHDDNIVYTFNRVKNSVSRSLTSVSMTRQYSYRWSRYLTMSAQIGGGYYVYEGYETSNYLLYINADTYHLLYSETNETTNKGFAPWFQTSLVYKSIGINLAYLPAKILRSDSVSAIILQLKVKL